MPAKQAREQNSQPDRLNRYSQLVLELGLCYENFTECINVPNRDRLIRTLKVMMFILKADSFRSKYGDEILRFLVLQCVVLSPHDAHSMFYSMFVNTNGNIDGNIPADLQMEFLVRLYKKHIKSMSNKREANIATRINALAGLHEIMKNYDTNTVHNVRTAKHSTSNKNDDELAMLADLRQYCPFKSICGRELAGFKAVESSMISKLDSARYIEWINRRSIEHSKSISN